MLVRSEQAQNFLSMIRTNVGKKVVADVAKAPSMKLAIETAFAILDDSLAKLQRLDKDLSRTEVQKHAAAKELADRAGEALIRTRDDIAAEAARMQASAGQAADVKFWPSEGKAHYEMRVLDWIKEQSGKAEGPSNIRAEMAKDIVVATVIYNSPSYITGLNREVHGGMKLTAVETYAPEAYKQLNESIALNEMVPRLEKTANQVHTSFYIKGMAEKEATRVDLDAAPAPAPSPVNVYSGQDA